MNIRSYKKQYAICKDDFGKMIYAGDTVELLVPFEVKTPWTSRVYWGKLYGAWVDSHPTHVQLFDAKKRPLYQLLNQSEFTMHDENDNPVKLKGYCKKIKSFKPKRK